MLRLLACFVLVGNAFAQAPAKVELIGIGSAGSAGTPRFSMRGSPVVGLPFSLEIEEARPMAVGGLLVSTDAADFSTSVLGAPVYVSLPGVLLPFVTDARGEAFGLLAVPATPASLVGASVVAQAFTLDASAPGGFSTTRGLRLRVGSDVRDELFYSTAPLHPTQFDYSNGIAGDFDGDGISDLAGGGYLALPVALTRPDLTFQESTLPLAGVAWTVAAGDVNNDGFQDLVAAVEAPPGSDLPVFLGRGDGTFQSPLMVDTTLIPSAVRVDLGDWNGDGNIDLVVAEHATSPSRFSLFQGAGDGTFARAGELLPSVAFPGVARKAIVDDIDQDGSADLILVWQWEVGVFLGTGGGAFVPGPTIDQTANSQNVAVAAVTLGDLDGDGFKDLVIGPFVLRNVGGGSFSVLSGPGPTGIATYTDAVLGDVDRDGDLDLMRVSGSVATFAARLARNDGAAGFTAISAAVGNTRGVQLVDLDADDLLDIVGPRHVRRGTGHGNFEYVVPDPATPVIPGPLDTAVARLNDDALLDSVCVAGGSAATPQLVVLHRDRRGLHEVQRRAIDLGPTRLVLADLNADGAMDAVIPSRFSGTVQVALGNGAGTFNALTSFPADAGAWDVGAGDFDADGVVDLVVACALSDTVTLLIGIGDGTFGAPTSFAVGARPNAVAVHDYDADGFLDVAVSCGNSNEVRMLDGSASGFALGASISVGALPVDLAWGDVNGDGSGDLVVAASSGQSVDTFLGDGLGGWSLAGSVNLSGEPRRVALGDLTGDTRLDLAISSSAGSGLFPGIGDGSFRAPSTVMLGSGFALGDWSGDLLPDITAGGRSLRNRLFD